MKKHSNIIFLSALFLSVALHLYAAESNLSDEIVSKSLIWESKVRKIETLDKYAFNYIIKAKWNISDRNKYNDNIGYTKNAEQRLFDVVDPLVYAYFKSTKKDDLLEKSSDSELKGFHVREGIIQKVMLRVDPILTRWGISIEQLNIISKKI